MKPSFADGSMICDENEFPVSNPCVGRRLSGVQQVLGPAFPLWKKKPRWAANTGCRNYIDSYLTGGCSWWIRLQCHFADSSSAPSFGCITAAAETVLRLHSAKSHKKPEE